MYKCAICKKEFDRKSNYTNHINKKNKCKYNSKTCKISNPECPKCHKHFTRKYSVDRHLKICGGNATKIKVKGNNNTNINMNGNDNTVNNTNNSKKTINNSVNIILLNFPPDKYTLSKDLAKILSSNENLVISMVKKTNVNKHKPEHHNIYYPDEKKSTGKIYTNNRWKTKSIDEILNMMVETKTEDLNEFLNEMCDILNNETKEKIKQAIKDFYDTKSRKKLKSYLKIILFDNKDMIKKTKKLAKYVSDSNDDDDSDDEINVKKTKKLKKYVSDDESDDEDSDNDVKSIKKSKKNKKK